jgi:hypothetical protein
MSSDPRCCGSEACIIDTKGHCWCGQQWDGTKMCLAPYPKPSNDEKEPPTSLDSDNLQPLGQLNRDS